MLDDLDLWAVSGRSYRSIYREEDLQEGEVLHRGERPEFPVDHIAEAEARRAQLTEEAQASVSLIQLKLMAGRKLTGAEATRLNVVLDYIDDIQKTDISNAPDIHWSDFPTE